MHKKRLLIIGAGDEQLPAYEQALKMGLKIVGSDMNPNAPGFGLADAKIIASTYDSHETLREVLKFNEKNPIDGVMTLAIDAPMTVALIAKELKLQGISTETAKLSSNKLLQLNKFKENCIPIPDYREIRSIGQLKHVIDKWRYPLIIKPPDSRGARGVLRLTEKTDIQWAYNESVSHSKTGSIIAEKYLQGYQISSESLVVNGTCHTAMYSGRNYEFLDRFSPYIIENGGWLPADITERDMKALDTVIQKAANSLGLNNGPLKGDLVLTDNGPAAIEFASRMGGGYAVSHSIPATHGINLVEQVIKLSIGGPINVTDLIPRYKQSAAIKFFFPEPGIVKAIKGFKKLDHCDWIVLKRMYCTVGDVIEKVTDHTKRAGCIMATGKDIIEAEQRVKELMNSIQIITK